MLQEYPKQCVSVWSLQPNSGYSLMGEIRDNGSFRLISARVARGKARARWELKSLWICFFYSCYKHIFVNSAAQIRRQCSAENRMDRSSSESDHTVHNDDSDTPFGPSRKGRASPFLCSPDFDQNVTRGILKSGSSRSMPSNVVYSGKFSDAMTFGIVE